MSVKQANLGNLQRKLCKRIRVSFAQDPLKMSKLKPTNGWYIFEQAKGLVIQWLSRISISRKFNFEGTYNMRTEISWTVPIIIYMSKQSRMFAQRIKIPVCTDLNKNLFKTVEILFYNFVVHVPWNILKTQWNLHFPPNIITACGEKRWVSLFPLVFARFLREDCVEIKNKEWNAGEKTGRENTKKHLNIFQGWLFFKKGQWLYYY